MPAEALMLDAAPRPGRVARLAQRLRERGIAATLRKAFADKVFRHSTSVMFEFRPEWGIVGQHGVRPDWLELAVVDVPADLPPLCPWLAPRRAAFLDMLADGKLAILALRHGTVVGCVWIALSDHRDRAAREFYRVGPHEAYHYCWLVDPALRRSNIALPLCRAVATAMVARGIVRQYGVVDRTNRASYLILKHFGYRECGVKVMHYVVFGSRWTRIARYSGTLGTVRKA